jgi:hypothetical protein
LLEYVRGFDKRAALPHRETAVQILNVFEELVDEKIKMITEAHTLAYGTPNSGTQSDLWSLKSCRATFGCLRSSFVLDGDMLADLLNLPEYKGQLVGMSPIVSFERFEESRHTGAALARWKQRVAAKWQLATVMATEDGASNNKAACRILNIPMKVCLPHDVARAVLTACGETGKPCQNVRLKLFIKRSSSQSASFNRSVVLNTVLREEQVTLTLILTSTLTQP